MSTSKYLGPCVWKKRVLTLSSFFSHFSGSTTIQLRIRNGVPSWPTSTLYSNPTDFNTVSPAPSIPWIFREIITWLHTDINCLLKQPAPLGQILSAQGQTGRGLHQHMWPGVEITWEGCHGSGWRKILSAPDHHVSGLNSAWPKKQFCNSVPDGQRLVLVLRSSCSLLQHLGVGVFPCKNVPVVQMVREAVLKAQEAAAEAYSGEKLELLSSRMCYGFPWNEGKKEEQGRLKLFSISTSGW